MDGLIAYILAKKIALGAVSGISNITLDENGKLTFIFNNGNTASMNIPLPEDGKTPMIDPITKHWVIDGKDTNVIAEGKDGDYIQSIKIESNHLICTLSNGKKIDAGELPYSSDSSVKFVTELPRPGQSSILYVYNDLIYYWNGSTYIKLSGEGGGDVMYWEPF